MKRSNSEPLAEKEFYVNPVALLHLYADQPNKTLIAGRAFGKSFINGYSIAQKVQHLPGARGIFGGASYTNILTNTITPMINCWEKMGYYQGVHYVIGQKPPDFFKLPYQPPQEYKNVISWAWGHATILGSMDRPQLLRGGSNDYSIFDEALLLNEELYGQIVIPTLRGSDIKLKGKKHHLNEEFTSSMPYGSVPGMWILDHEKKAEKYPDHFHYIEGTTLDNVVIVGMDVIKKWKRSMSKIAFDIECLNKRITRHGSQFFYPTLSDKHWYPAEYNYDYIDTLGFNLNPKKGATIQTPDSRWDRDCDPNLAIHISHDWGAFNTIVIDQYKDKINEVRTINNMYVEHPKIIDDLAIDFCKYYENHKNKTVHQWGDKSGNKREANSKVTMFEQFANVLRRKGWRVIKEKTGDIEHLDRHNFMVELHRETNSNLPRIRHNAEKCKDLKIALESAPMDGIKKDKSSERKTSRIKPQHATHSTDAYDYRLYHAFKHRSSMSSGAAPTYGIRIGSRTR